MEVQRDFSSVGDFQGYLQSLTHIPFAEVGPKLVFDRNKFQLHLYPLQNEQWIGSGCWVCVAGSLKEIRFILEDLLSLYGIKVFAAFKASLPIYDYLGDYLHLEYSTHKDVLDNITKSDGVFIDKYFTDATKSVFDTSINWDDIN